MKLKSIALTLACLMFALSVGLALAQVPKREVFWLEVTVPAEKIGQKCILDSRTHKWTEEKGVITVTEGQPYNGKHCDVGVKGFKGELLPYE